jgi:hypothetical protein
VTSVTTTPAGLVDATKLVLARQAAQALDIEVRALAGFDEGSPWDSLDTAAMDFGRASVEKSADFADSGRVSVTSQGATVCLTVSTDRSAPGTVTDGPC